MTTLHAKEMAIAMQVGFASASLDMKALIAQVG